MGGRFLSISPGALHSWVRTMRYSKFGRIGPVLNRYLRIVNTTSNASLVLRTWMQRFHVLITNVFDGTDLELERKQPQYLDLTCSGWKSVLCANCSRSSSKSVPPNSMELILNSNASSHSIRDQVGNQFCVRTACVQIQNRFSQIRWN